jgi:hypothetical protein
MNAPRRKMLKRTLGLLAALVLLGGLWHVTNEARRIRNQRTARTEILQLGGSFVYRSQVSYTQNTFSFPPPGPTACLTLWEPAGLVARLPSWIDRDWFDPVTVVQLEQKKISRETLAAIGKLPSLEYLDLNVADFPADGLASLASCRSLKYLKLLATGIGDADLGFLANTAALEELGLSKTHVGDRCLETVVRLRGLRRLELDQTRVTGSGLAVLSTCGNLEHLELFQTDVNDDGLKHLKNMPALRHLDLRATKVTQAGVDDLRRALPQCTVYWERNYSDHDL